MNGSSENSSPSSRRREGIEIEVDEQWLPVDDAPAPPPTERDGRVWGRLTDTHVEWLAVESRAPFRCTRVVEMPAQATEQDVVIVAYVNDAGRNRSVSPLRRRSADRARSIRAA